MVLQQDFKVQIFQNITHSLFPCMRKTDHLIISYLFMHVQPFHTIFTLVSSQSQGFLKNLHTALCLMTVHDDSRVLDEERLQKRYIQRLLIGLCQESQFKSLSTKIFCLLQLLYEKRSALNCISRALAVFLKSLTCRWNNVNEIKGHLSAIKEKRFLTHLNT